MYAFMVMVMIVMTDGRCVLSFSISFDVPTNTVHINNGMTMPFYFPHSAVNMACEQRLSRKAQICYDDGGRLAKI